jgi:hypothetical protein
MASLQQEEKSIFDINFHSNSKIKNAVDVSVNEELFDEIQSQTLELWKNYYEKCKPWLLNNPLTYGCANEFTTRIVNKVVQNNHTVLSGLIQGGKTEEMMKLALQFYFVHDLHVIILLNNYSVDKKTFMERLHRHINSYINTIYFVEDVDINDIKQEVVIDMMDHKLDPKQRKEDFNPRIRLAMCNPTQLKKVEKLIKRNRKHEFVIIADESDLIAIKPNDDDETKERKRKASQRSEVVSRLLLHSKCNKSVRVTGTEYAHLCVNETVPITGDNVFTLPVHKSYVSMYHGSKPVKLVPCPSNLFLKTHNDVLDSNDRRTLVEYIDKRNQYLRDLNQLPVYLFTISHLVNVQYTAIQNFIMTVYEKQALCIHICRGIVTLEHKDFGLSNKLSLQGMLHEIQKLELDPNEYMVFIVGHNMISRGQSPRSEVENYSHFKDIIFAQTHIMATRPNTCIDTLEQKAFRINGKFHGHEDLDFPQLEIFLPQRDIDNIKSVGQWKHKMIQKINQERVESYLTSLLDPLQHPKGLKLRKLTSYAPRTRRVKKDNKTLTCFTQESYLKTKAEVEHESQEQEIRIVTGTSVFKILEILISSPNDWMTAEDIYNSEDDWDLEGLTPVATIRAHCYRLLKANYVIRNRVDNKYLYRIK